MAMLRDYVNVRCTLGCNESLLSIMVFCFLIEIWTSLKSAPCTLYCFTLNYSFPSDFVFLLSLIYTLINCCFTSYFLFYITFTSLHKFTDLPQILHLNVRICLNKLTVSGSTGLSLLPVLGVLSKVRSLPSTTLQSKQQKRPCQTFHPTPAQPDPCTWIL